MLLIILESGNGGNLESQYSAQAFILYMRKPQAREEAFCSRTQEANGRVRLRLPLSVFCVIRHFTFPWHRLRLFIYNSHLLSISCFQVKLPEAQWTWPSPHWAYGLVQETDKWTRSQVPPPNKLSNYDCCYVKKKKKTKQNSDKDQERELFQIRWQRRPQWPFSWDLEGKRSTLTVKGKWK